MINPFTPRGFSAGPTMMFRGRLACTSREPSNIGEAMNWDRVVEETPALKRGQVWCHECGRTERVDSAHCLQHGWPKCCTYTMSIDSPEERASRGPSNIEGNDAMNYIIIGTCGNCGGFVAVPKSWGGSQPPNPTCQLCGATSKNRTTPPMPMNPPVKSFGPKQ